MTGPESQSRRVADNTTLLLGVVTIVSGAATGLFSDLRLLGKVVGLLAFPAWVLAIGLILWARTRERGRARCPVSPSF
jgi:hypothetical protein